MSKRRKIVPASLKQTRMRDGQRLILEVALAMSFPELYLI